MKKTRTIKHITIAILAVIVLLALPSCKTQDTEKTTESEETMQTEKVIGTEEGRKTERVKFTSFEKALNELISETDTYKISLYDSAETEFDEGEKTILHVFDITNDLVYIQTRLTLFVFCNGNNELRTVSCTSTDGIDADIALISRYVYLALGLSEMDTDAFYDAFAFFEESPEEKYEIEENGWFLDVSYREDSVHFTAIQLDI